MIKNIIYSAENLNFLLDSKVQQKHVLLVLTVQHKQML